MVSDMPVDLPPSTPSRSSGQAPSALDQGRYQLVRKIGTGGMATVWHALDCGLGIPCAVKILNAPLARDAGLRARFLHEAQTMARLRHPSIVEVKNLGEEDGCPYIVMELIEGSSLSDHITEHGPLPPQLAVDALLSVLDAVAFAHDHGVIHRDLKPANVLLSHGPRFKLTDFGIARPLAPRDRKLTQTNVAMGTWGFMAPEQSHNARDVDTRADIYAAGATLFALLTGIEPVDLFVAEHNPSILTPIPAALHEVIRSATCYYPESRYQTAEEMRAALAPLRDALPADPGYPLPDPTRPAAPISGTGFPASSSISRSGVTPTAIPPNTDGPPPPSATTTSPPPTLDTGLDLDSDTQAELTALFSQQRRRWPLVLAGLLVAGVALGAYTIQQRATPPAPIAPEPAPAPTLIQPEPTPPTPAEPEPEPEPELEAVIEPAPVPAPAPTVEPVRAPAPEPAPPAETQVSVAGEAESVLLKDSRGRQHQPGVLPAGRYTILADFGMGSAPAGEVVLSGQPSVTIRCARAFATCKAQ